MSIFLRLAQGPTGVLLAFDGHVDDVANFDFAAGDFLPTGRRDSFLALTGYRRDYLPFEFVRRLAWSLAGGSGVFEGCVLHRAARESSDEYDDTNLVTRIPRARQIEPSWMRGDQDTTIYFPRSIDDLVSLVNQEWHDAVIYLGFSNEDGFITRMDEDDEWHVACDSARAEQSVVAVAESMGLPVRREGAFEAGAAAASARDVPEITLVDERVHVRRGGVRP